MEIDYINGFFDYGKGPADPSCRDNRSIAREEFRTLCSRFLNGIGIKSGTADAIALCLLSRMSDMSLHYHTPVHVLSMFQWAADNNISLEKHEELAVWFHDAIYIPGAVEGQNEYESLAFMRSLLGSFVDEDTLAKAGNIIKATARHLEKNIGHIAHKVMDLDLISFAFPNQQLITDLIWKEHGHLCMEDKFHQGRKAFLKKLIEKGFVYRSEPFLRLNPIVIEQIRRITNEEV